jgi:hypothetical protein
MGDYLTWLRNDYRPALEKAGVSRFQVAQPIFGAAAGEIVTMRMLRNLSEIDGGSVLSHALSDAEARVLVAKATPLVSSSHTRIIRMRAELSFAAPGLPAKNQLAETRPGRTKPSGVTQIRP